MLQEIEFEYVLTEKKKLKYIDIHQHGITLYKRGSLHVKIQIYKIIFIF